ncbi:hypothetical protein [uncultured Oscillibacter sp.]|uniref:hypothetical protein n=1 Tax=uncultured Oscillibacter sp. TaxID=876091 RepID=UPI0025E3203D|nr:hypothetical protein [uncultured Oscillibacter sp.]
MKRKTLRDGGQLPAAGAFLLLSLALMWVAASAAPSAADAVILPDLTEELPVPDAPEPPAGALAEGERLAGEELRYVQRDFPELGCTEVRLREVRKVCACDHMKGEYFEIYKADFLYDGPSGWEELDRGSGRYLIFRETDGGPEWLGDFAEYSDPEMNGFEDRLHEHLMDLSETYLFRLQAAPTAEAAVEQTLAARMERTVPGDYAVIRWKPLAAEETADGGTAYGLMLYYTFSGSTMIYSEETGRYTAGIYSAYLLPTAVDYCLDGGAYLVTDVWEPSRERYADEVRAHFPVETAEDVLQNIGAYAVSMAGDGDAPKMEFYPHGPTWPSYDFSACLSDGDLCAMADYYRDTDIYAPPVRDELCRRFSEAPGALLNALGEWEPETQERVCAILAERCGGRLPEKPADLTPEGETAYETLLHAA